MGSDAPGARRRGRNEGSIYKDEAGYGPDGQTWRRHKVSGRTRVEVAEKLKQLQAERDSGVQPERAYTVQRAVDAASRLGPSPWSPRRPSRQQASAG
jgi:hypothetical protein